MYKQVPSLSELDKEGPAVQRLSQGNTKSPLEPEELVGMALPNYGFYLPLNHGTAGIFNGPKPYQV